MPGTIAVENHGDERDVVKQLQSQIGEGCNIYGTLQLSKVFFFLFRCLLQTRLETGGRQLPFFNARAGLPCAIARICAQGIDQHQPHDTAFVFRTGTYSA